MAPQGVETPGEAERDGGTKQPACLPAQTVGGDTGHTLHDIRLAGAGSRPEDDPSHKQGQECIDQARQKKAQRIETQSGSRLFRHRQHNPLRLSGSRG